MANYDFLNDEQLKKSLRYNWKIFSRPHLLFVSVINSKKQIQIAICLISTCLLVSIAFFSWGLYIAFTKEIAINGGEIREAVLNEDIKHFNPVLTPNSEAENRMTSLLYHPLYIVKTTSFSEKNDNNPTIVPVLLENSPQWKNSDGDGSQNFTKLVFNLKKNLKWSNSQPITISDVEYTFDRLKEKSANTEFSDAFDQISFERINDLTFALNSTISYPNLINIANFSPISKDYYESKSIDKLLSDFRSNKPMVTSGFYTFTSSQVVDPNDDKKPLRDNPIRSHTEDTYQTVYLDKNPIQNYQNVYIQKYIFRRFTKLGDVGGNNSISLEAEAKAGKIDIFIRNILPSNLVQSSEVRSKINLTQSKIPTNIYYSLFFNLKVPGYQSVSLNPTLRKYIFCSLIKNFRTLSDPNISIIDQTRQIVPTQLSDFNQPACDGDPVSWLDPKIFSLNKDDKRDSLELIQNALGTQIKLVLLAQPNSETITSDIQKALLDIGIATDLVPVNSQSYKDKIVNNEFNIALVPLSISSKDLSTVYGSKGLDINQISLNNNKSLLARKFSENLDNYIKSNFRDESSKKQLIEFFVQENVSLNLVQINIELNYSERIRGLKGFSYTPLKSSNIYDTLPMWHTKVERSLAR